MRRYVYSPAHRTETRRRPLEITHPRIEAKPYAWRNGQPFTLIAVVKPGDDPAVDDDCGSMFRINSLMATRF